MKNKILFNKSTIYILIATIFILLLVIFSLLFFSSNQNAELDTELEDSNNIIIPKENQMDIKFDYDAFATSSPQCIENEEIKKNGSWPDHGATLICQRDSVNRLIASRLFKINIIEKIIKEPEMEGRLDFYYLSDFEGYISNFEKYRDAYCKFTLSRADLGNLSDDTYYYCAYEKEKELNQQLDATYKYIQDDYFSDYRKVFLSFKDFIPSEEDLKDIINSPEFKKHNLNKLLGYVD